MSPEPFEAARIPLEKCGEGARSRSWSRDTRPGTSTAARGDRGSLFGPPGTVTVRTGEDSFSCVETYPHEGSRSEQGNDCEIYPTSSRLWIAGGEEEGPPGP